VHTAPVRRDGRVAEPSGQQWIGFTAAAVHGRCGNAAMPKYHGRPQQVHVRCAAPRIRTGPAGSAAVAWPRGQSVVRCRRGPDGTQLAAESDGAVDAAPARPLPHRRSGPGRAATRSSHATASDDGGSLSRGCRQTAIEPVRRSRQSVAVYPSGPENHQPLTEVGPGDGARAGWWRTECRTGVESEQE